MLHLWYWISELGWPGYFVFMVLLSASAWALFLGIGLVVGLWEKLTNKD